ncbi:MAG: 4-(cytidine 5'-diphospho)-2-C-methyl-D-erythritol kinase, partial [bacterium]
MPDSVTGLAHAKVNLVLEVLGLRPDGYHEIDTVLQEVELTDVVTVAASEQWAVTATGPRSHGVPADDTNLALKAARLLGERVQASPVTIELEKHIPAAGGLGGGASDAATTLMLLAKLWPGVTAE